MDAHAHRRFALIAARNRAIVKRDWAAMNEITKRLVKLDTPTPLSAQARRPTR